MTSQGINKWATSDLPFELRNYEEENEGLREWSGLLKGFETLGRSDLELDMPDTFLVDLDSSEVMRGRFNITEAMADMSGRDYYGGLSGNQFRDKYSANMQLATYNREKYKGTMLELTQQNVDLLKYYAEKSKWNLAKIGSGFVDEETKTGVDMWDMPLLTNFNETPDDLIGMDAPEGWNADQALEVLKIKDPTMYRAYLSTFGSEENLKDLVADAETPSEFFYNLNDEMQMISYMKSVSKWYETASAAEIAAEYAYNFVIQGILNDPDLAESLGVSAAAGAVSFGAGAVLGAKITLVAKFLKTGYQGVKFAQWVAKFQKNLSRIQRYLPENIGPTLIQKIPAVKSFSERGMLARITANRLADVGEGAVSGAYAEVFNQYRQVYRAGTSDGMSVKGVLQESLIESVFSPVINPAIGGLYLGVGQLGLQTTQITSNLLLKENQVAGIKNFIKTAKGWVDPETQIARLELIEILGKTKEGISDLTLEGTEIDVDSPEGTDPNDPTKPSGILAAIVHSLYENSGLSKLQIIESINEIVGELKTRGEDGQSVFAFEAEQINQELLMAKIAQEVVQRNANAIMNANDGDSQSLDSILGWVSHHIEIGKKAKAEGMTYEAYIDKIIEEGTEFDLVPQDLQDAVQKEMGENFEGASTEDKIKVASELLAKRINKANERQIKANEDTKENQKELNSIEQDFIGPKPKKQKVAPKDPETPVEDTTEDTTDAVEDPAVVPPTSEEPGLEADEPVRRQGLDPLQKQARTAQRAADLKQKVSKEETDVDRELEKDPPEKRKRKLIAEKKRLSALRVRLEKMQDKITLETASLMADLDINDERTSSLLQTMIEQQDRLDKIIVLLNSDLKDDKGIIFGNNRIRRIIKLQQEFASSVAEDIADSDSKDVRVENFSEKTKEILKELREVLQGDTSKTGVRFLERIEELLQTGKSKVTAKKYSTKSLMQDLRKIETIRKAQEQRRQKTDEYKEAIELEEALKETDKEYRTIVANIQKEETIADIQKFQALRLQQTGAKERKKQTELFDAGQRLFDSALARKKENNETFTAEEIARYLHPYSEWKENKELLAEREPSGIEESEKVMNETYTVEEAEDIFRAESESAASKIKYLGVGKMTDIRVGGRYQYVRGDWVHNHSSDDVLGTSYDVETVLEKSNEDGKELDEPVRQTGTVYLDSPTETYGTLIDGFTARDNVAQALGFVDYYHAVNSYNLYVLGIGSSEENFNKAAKGIGEKEMKEAWDARSKLNEDERTLLKGEKQELVKKLKDKKRGTEIKFTRSLDKDVEAWIQFEANLNHLASIRDPEEGISAWEINQAMPPYLRDYVGLKPYHVFGRNNVLGRSRSALRDNDLVDVNTAAMIDLQIIQNTLRYDPESLVQIARAWKERGLAKIEGWRQDQLATVLDSLEEASRDESNPNSAVNLYTALEFVERMDEASSAINEALFNERQPNPDNPDRTGGWILEVDPDTGFPVKFTRNKGEWIQEARFHIRARVSSMLSQNKIRDIRNIADKFNLTLNKRQDESGRVMYEVVMPDGEILTKNIEDVIADAIIDNLGGLYQGDNAILLEDFGNGRSGYGSAKNAGYGIVDFLSDKPQPNIQNLTAIADKDGNPVPGESTEEFVAGGEPVTVRLPMEGEINFAMPIPAMQMARIVQNYKARERIRFILGKDKFTKKQRQAYEAWRDAKWSDLRNREVSPVGDEADLPFFIIPQIVGATLQEAVMTRAKAKEMVMEMVLDVPRNAQGFIHDQITQEKVMFNEGVEEGVITVEVDGKEVEIDRRNLADTGEGLMYDLSHGDHVLVPLGRIGEVMAIEAMGPMFKGFTDAAIKRVMKLREAREAEGTGVNLDMLMSLDNWSDRTASGVFEHKLLSLAHDPTATLEVDGETLTGPEIIERIASGGFRGKPKAELDFYMLAAIKGLAGVTSFDSELGQIFKIIQDTDIRSVKDYLALQEKAKTDEEIKKQAEAIKKLRSIFKVPVMRKIYGGGMPNFIKEFSKGGEGWNAMVEAGIKPSEENIKVIREAIFSQSGHHETRVLLVELALGSNDKTKTLVHKYLMIDQDRDKPLIDAWRDLMKMDNKALGESLENTATHIDLLDAKLRQMWRLDTKQGEMSFEEWKKTKGWDERFEKAKKFLEEKKEAGEPIHPGSPNYSEFQAILSGVEDKLSAETIGYLRALNIQNSQEYRLNAERMQEAADLLGLTDFDINDYLGFEKHALYHLMLPSGNSTRDYATSNQVDTMGISLERVARKSLYQDKDTGKYYESFLDFLKSEDAEGLSRDEILVKFDAFLETDKDNADSLGMFDLRDPSLREDRDSGMTDKQLEDKVEDLMIKQEMLLWSRYDKPPADVFPDYTEEVSETSILEKVLESWRDHSERRHRSLQQEMEFEMSEWKRAKTKSRYLKLKNKAGGLVNKAVVAASDQAFRYTPYHVSENNPTSVMIHTSGRKGPMAVRPKYKESQYYDMGFFKLQRLHIQERLNNLLGPLHSIRNYQETLRDEDVMVGGQAIGGYSPWNAEELPQVLPVLPAHIAIDMGSNAGQRAAKLYYEVHSWARDRGLERQLEEEPSNFARFYVIKEAERARRDVMLRVRERDLVETSDTVAHRNAWISGLHDVARYSRDIKNPEGRRKLEIARRGDPVAVVNPPTDDMKWIDIFTSVASEDNPDGTLLRRTMLDDAFKFGTDADYNTLIVDEGEEIETIDLFEVSDLTKEGWAVQGADKAKFLAAILYTEAYGNVLRTYKEGKYSKFAMDPTTWEQEIGKGMTTEEAIQERTEIRELARQYVAGMPSFELEVGIEEVIYQDVKEGEGKKTNQYRLQISRKSREGEAAKSPYGAAVGFGMMFMTSQKITAKNAKIILGPQEAMKMFVALENATTMRDLTLSSWLNKGLGVKIDNNGQVVRAVPLQDAIASGLGYDGTAIKHAALNDSESLLRASSEEGGVTLRSVRDPLTSVEGRIVEIVDLDYYSSGEGARWNDGNLGTSVDSWRESYISPVRKLVHMLSRDTIGPGTEIETLKQELETLIVETRNGSQAAFNKLRLVALKLEDPNLDLTKNKVKLFFKPEELEADSWSIDLQSAMDLSARIKMNISDEGVRLNNKHHYAARQFLLENPDGSLNPDDAYDSFLQTRIEKGVVTPAEDGSISVQDEREMQDAIRNAIRELTDITSRDELPGSIFEQNWDSGVGRSTMELTDVIKKIEAGDGVETFDPFWQPLVRDQMKQIDELVHNGRIDKKESVAVKVLLARAFMLNPDIVHELKFKALDQILKRGAEAERAGGKFTIRLGSNFRSVAKDSFTAVEIIAHELGHIARLKFIKDFSPEYMELVGLSQSTAGRSMMKKAVIAWHGGVETEAANEEFLGYIEDPEEFIAGFVSLYLLADVQPVIRGLTTEELGIWGKFTSSIKRMMGYLSNTMLSLRGAFETDNVEFDKKMRRMALNVFGYDSSNDVYTGNQFDSTDIADKRFGWRKKMDKLEVLKVDPVKDLEIRNTIRKENELKAKDSLTPEEQTELDNIVMAKGEGYYGEPVGLGTAGEGASTIAMTRYEYIGGLDQVKGKYAAETQRQDLENELRNPTDEVIIDLERVLVEGDSFEKAVTFVYLAEGLFDTYGEPVNRGLGSLANNMSPGLRDGLVGALLGDTGHQGTWNSHNLIALLLTSLIDDNVVTNSGGFTNTRGTPSVRRELELLSSFTQSMRENKKEIVKILNGPLYSTVRGEEKMKKSTQEVFKVLNVQIIESVDEGAVAGSYEYDLSEDALGVVLSEEEKQLIKEQLNQMASTFRQMAEKNIDTGQSIGEFGTGFTNVVPYRLSTSVNSDLITAKGTFVDIAKAEIKKKLISEFNANGRVEGTMMLAAGFLPHLGDNAKGFSDLKNLKENHRALYDFILEYSVTDKTGDVRAKVMILDSKLQGGDIMALNKVRLGSTKLMNQLTKGNVTVNQMFAKGTRTQTTRFKEAYKGFIETVENVNTRRLEGLTKENLGITPNIRVEGRVKARSLSSAFGVQTNPLDHIFFNFLERSAVGAYYPNDNFALPSVKAMLNSHDDMKEFFVTDLTALAENARHGLYNEVSEKKTMREFGVHGDVKQVLNLLSAVNNSNYAILDSKGENNPRTKSQISDTVTILNEKHNAMRKVRPNTELSPSNAIDSAIPEVANAVTRIAFGGNLFLATSIVENGYSALDELIGRRNLTGFIRTAFAPIMGITNREERKRVLKDFSYLIDSMTQGYLPEFEKPFGSQEDGITMKLFKGMGNEQMRLAKWQLKNITAARAINARSWIQSGLDLDSKGRSKLLELATKLEEKNIDKLPIEEQERALKGAMKESGYSNFEGDLQLVSYLMRAGLLQVDKVIDMQTMMPEEGRYSPFEMSHELFTTRSSRLDRQDYNRKLDVITGLKEVERKYVEEAILTPNVFDVRTGELDTPSALFEIYRRYPVLFASQQMIRRTSRSSVGRTAFGLTSLLLMDMLYMTALQLAAGIELDDILEEYEEDGFAKFSKLLVRTPLLGRWLSLLGPVLAMGIDGISQGKFPGQYDFSRALSKNTGFIPFAALGTTLGAVSTGAQAGAAMFGLTTMPNNQDMLNATRIIPYADSAIRLGVYTLGGDGISRDSNRRTGGGTTGSSQTPNLHYGMRSSHAAITWNNDTKEMYKQVLDGNIPDVIKEFNTRQALVQSLENIGTPPAPVNQPSSAALQQPAPPEITTPTSKPEDVVSSIIDRDTQEAPEGLFGQ